MRKFSAVLALFAVFALGACADKEETVILSGPTTTVAPSTQPDADPTSTAAAEPALFHGETETTDQVTGLPLVSGGNPADPTVGNPDSQPAVIGEVRSWTDAVARMEAEQPWYATCTDSRIGVNLDEARSFAALEQRHDLRFILVVNSSFTDEQARAALVAEGFQNVEALSVRRVEQIRNTRRTHVGGDNRCQPFWDQRPQVRLSLGIPVLDANDHTKVVGLEKDMGLLGHCGNPWDLPPVQPPPPPPVTTVPPTTTTVPPGTTTVPPTSTTQPPTGTTTPPTQPTVPPTPPPTNPVTTTTKPPYTTQPPSQVTITPTVPNTPAPPPPTAPPDTTPGGVTPTTVNSVPPDDDDSETGAATPTLAPAPVTTAPAPAPPNTTPSGGSTVSP